MYCEKCKHPIEKHIDTQLGGFHCRDYSSHGKYQYTNSTIVVPIGWLDVLETCGCTENDLNIVKTNERIC